MRTKKDPYAHPERFGELKKEIIKATEIKRLPLRLKRLISSGQKLHHLMNPFMTGQETDYMESEEVFHMYDNQ